MSKTSLCRATLNTVGKVADITYNYTAIGVSAGVGLTVAEKVLDETDSELATVGAYFATTSVLASTLILAKEGVKNLCIKTKVKLSSK